MKFALAINGTRGDVEPCAALGRELSRRGHEVRVAVPPSTPQPDRRGRGSGLGGGALRPRHRRAAQRRGQPPGILEAANFDQVGARGHIGSAPGLV
ncbi:glycosyltransferase [Mycobacterium ulcerans]|uniref:glycosyltransferase n=1 Tax=Mycobacterium ulcerans TaxID=1809 RepID=UPI00214ACB42|nr:glycosyltransferase [Mycobacterium ulcerans]